MLQEVYLYSDGSCLSNPGPGGWASILEFNGIEKEISGGAPDTTNNRMELCAVIGGLMTLRHKCIVHVVTDSQYVVNAFNKGWIFNWERNKYKGRTNSDLWIKLKSLVDQHQVDFTWIKGHAGHPYNERCDKLAKAEASGYLNGMM